MSGSTGCDASKQVSRHHDVGRGSAYALLRSFSEGINAAGPHVAVTAAKSRLPKAALGLLLLKAIPGSFLACPGHDGKHLSAGRICGPLTNILNHIGLLFILVNYYNKQPLNDLILLNSYHLFDSILMSFVNTTFNSCHRWSYAGQ
jgi:hypothetical protein